MRTIIMSFLLAANLLAGESFIDCRTAPPKDLDGYFPFQVPPTKEAWAARRAQLREQVLVATGLFPLPVKAPLNAVRHGRKDLGDYFIEKVYFESFPGFFVTGSLYVPKEIKGKLPAVLCPHGHWNNGRFMMETEDAAKKQIEAGAEEFIEAGRSPLQARCVHLARMGCVVFHYDMLGNADSQQISYDTTHKFGSQKVATPGGFYTAEAEGQLQSILGLQTWDSIRALDFVESLSEVDPQRIGVTGASGGGSQTFLLAAVDDRPAAIFPAVMVTTAMQGGCTCENASLLRIGTGNVEVAAIFAPKPLAMTAADDWTKEMTTKGFPELKQLYTMLGAPDNVHLTSLTQFPHNYNHPSRVAMEQWFARHLLKAEMAEPERHFNLQTPEDLTVWDAAHPAPRKGPEAERDVLKQWRQATKGDPATRHDIDSKGWRVILGRDLDGSGKVVYEMNGEKVDLGTYFAISGDVRNHTHQEVVPTQFYFPKDWKHRVAVWVTTEPVKKVVEAKLGPEIAKLLASGWAVAVPELIQPGATTNRRVANPREAPSYTYGYNYPLFAQRVHDVLTVLKMVQTHPDYQTDKLVLCAGVGGRKFVAAASRVTGKALSAAVCDLNGLRFDDVADPYAADFMPGAAKYGNEDEIKIWSASGGFVTMEKLLEMK